jgi:hypothetical protein
MHRYAWGSLKPLQLGKYAEYFVKMEFALYGLDIYTSEVDDKGIDFVARNSANKYWDIQVKSAYKSKYIFFPKSTFDVERSNLLVAVIPFVDSEAPALYLIPARAWKTPNSLLVSRDYEGKKSAPEWGLQLSKRNLPLLSPYAFERVVDTL